MNEACCDLEVDVNGEQSFMVNKGFVASYSGRLSKLLEKSKGSTRNLKVVFHDFPGGAKTFELISRFCYTNGSIDITPSNITLLHFAALFMEMDISVSGERSLIEKTVKSLEKMRYWSWSELLVSLEQCQDLLPGTNCLSILENCLDCIVGRLALSSEASTCPSSSSPDSSGIRSSCDTRSTGNLKMTSSRPMWWFEDLLILGPILVEMLVKLMVSRKLDHVTISRFLFYYQKSKFYTVKADVNRAVAETVIDMLQILDQASVSCKTLFWILRVVQNMNIDKSIRNKLESMIGSQLDQASLDDLLVPSPHGINHSYDVSLVLRFVNSFLHGEITKASPVRLRKVGVLVDLYIAEVAPDPRLRPSKFSALTMALPDAARDSYDELYRAIDMYLEVHGGLSEDEKMKLCHKLNYEKLSEGACRHLTQNAKFPSKSAIQALISQQCKLRSLLHVTNTPKSYRDSPFSVAEVDVKGRNGPRSNEGALLNARKIDLKAENENLGENLHGMQWRVMKLETMCKKMQTQMAKFTKSRVVSSHSHARSLPKLCS